LVDAPTARDGRDHRRRLHPEIIVRGIVEALAARYQIAVEEFGEVGETVTFKRVPIG